MLRSAAMPTRVEPVAAEPAVLPDLHQSGGGEHAEVLRDGGPGHRELRRQLGHGALSPAQQLEQPSTVGLGQHSQQVRRRWLGVGVAFCVSLTG